MMGTGSGMTFVGFLRGTQGEAVASIPWLEQIAAGVENRQHLDAVTTPKHIRATRAILEHYYSSYRDALEERAATI